MVPKVSVVIPVYNVEKYLRQCLDSVVNQTLKDIEIICVNDGSSDSSPQILEEYAARDPRVRIITKENSGYGASMNRGFDAASGEYLGIVESDDYAEPDMFEKLYNQAAAQRLDVIKSGFFFYYSVPVEKNVANPIASRAMCSRVFCPVTDFKAPLEQADFFNIKPTIWSAIYRRQFILDHRIRFNETPGASFQDSSFNFKVWCCARRVQLTEACYLHYRQDNESSSINSPGKVYCVADEYNEMERFLKEEKPELRGKMEGIRCRLKYDSYIWNYERLSPALGKEFLFFASKDFAQDMAEGLCERQYFPWYKWAFLLDIIKDPRGYMLRRERELLAASCPVHPDAHGAPRSARRRAMETVARYWRQGRFCLREFGWGYTFKKAMRKVQRRFF